MSGPEAGPGSTGSATVAVGSYRLELGAGDGSFALFEPEPEQEQEQALGDALNAPEPGALTPAETGRVEEALTDASTVTERAQRCLTLFTEIAEGHALDPKVVSEELDSLLALVGRLDRAGRHKEALRLARDLASLLALLPPLARPRPLAPARAEDRPRAGRPAVGGLGAARARLAPARRRRGSSSRKASRGGRADQGAARRRRTMRQPPQPRRRPSRSR